MKLITRDKYVVRDGINEEPFTDDTTWHDGMISVDMELISVQKLRRGLTIESTFLGYLLMEASLPDKAHTTLIMYMCRTESDKGNREI